MHPQLKNPKLYCLIFIDAVLLAMAHFMAYLLRFEFSLTPPEWQSFWSWWPWIVLLKMVCFYFFGLS